MVLCMTELELLNLHLQMYAKAEERGDKKMMRKLFPMIAIYDDYTPGIGIMSRYLTGTSIYPNEGIRINNNNIKYLNGLLFENGNANK